MPEPFEIRDYSKDKEAVPLIPSTSSLIQRYTKQIYLSSPYPFKCMFISVWLLTIIYISTGAAYQESSDYAYKLIKFIFMFFLCITLIIDGFYSFNILNRHLELDETAITTIVMKIILFIAINVYYIIAYDHGEWIAVFHDCTTPLIFIITSILQEFVFIQFQYFRESLKPFDRYDDAAVYSDYSNDDLYSRLQSNREKIQFYCLMNSITLPILIILTFLISMIAIAEENHADDEFETNGIPIYYITHFILVFVSIEGSIRKASSFNYLIADISIKLNYRTNHYITIFGILPVGFLLFSYYLSFLLAILKYVYKL